MVAENCRTLLGRRRAGPGGGCLLLVLDEVIDALRGFLPQRLCAFWTSGPRAWVVLTGHSLPEALEPPGRLHHPHEAPLRPGRNRPQGNRI